MYYNFIITSISPKVKTNDNKVVVYKVYTNIQGINTIINTTFQKIKTHIYTKIMKNDTLFGETSQIHEI